MTQYSLALHNSDQDTDIIGDPSGFNIVRLAFDQAPSAGTVVIKYRQPWTNTFTTLAHANGQSITSGFLQVRIDDPVAVIRVTFTGLVGGVAPRLWVEQRELPDGLFSGNAAITTQSYVEANVKNGLQFYARAVYDLASPIPVGQTRKLYFKTGAKHIIVKLREMNYVAEELLLRIFANPTGVTGGVILEIHNYNSDLPVATSILDAKKDVTTLTDGVEIDGGNAERFFGPSSPGQRVQSATPSGVERHLPENSEFLVSITNTGTYDARVQYFLTWFEGQPDAPL